MSAVAEWLCLPARKRPRGCTRVRDGWLRPTFSCLPFGHYLLGVMHSCHSTFDQWVAAVWKDIDTLHPDSADQVKYDFVEALVGMGVSCLMPARRECKDVERPSFGGTDLSVMRAELGMLTVLQIVYGVADFLDGDDTASSALGTRASSAANASTVITAEAEMLARRAARPANQAARAHALAPRRPALQRACAALMALWEVHRVLKATTYDDSTAQLRRKHADRFRASFEDFNTKLIAMTSEDVQSQCLTEAMEVMPDLIERWGKVVAYVNERVQEHMMKLTKDFARHASDRSIHLGSCVAHLADGRTI
mmetsp:Transcript_22142/g.56881  ORF Transcript_22142/g.56881 Transcript_22142/m.56881 type:complete len:309 (-) Transcript_22142:559-1485(-)